MLPEWCIFPRIFLSVSAGKYASLRLVVYIKGTFLVMLLVLLPTGGHHRRGVRLCDHRRRSSCRVRWRRCRRRRVHRRVRRSHRDASGDGRSQDDGIAAEEDRTQVEWSLEVLWFRPGSGVWFSTCFCDSGSGFRCSKNWNRNTYRGVKIPDLHPDPESDF